MRKLLIPMVMMLTGCISLNTLPLFDDDVVENKEDPAPYRIEIECKNGYSVPVPVVKKSKKKNTKLPDKKVICP